VYSNVSGFSHAKYLLAHGTGDGTLIHVPWLEKFPVFLDNVHFQNSAMLVDALTKINVQFQYMVLIYKHLMMNTTYIIKINGFRLTQTSSIPLANVICT